MTVDKAIQTLRSYPCVCEYGTSPFKCEDSKCQFGDAIRTLVDEVKNNDKD